MSNNDSTYLFTVVTVTWNAARVLPPTLESVKAQRYTDFEYLVVDGASTDHTLQLVRDADIAATRIVSEPDRGLYDAMNKAIGLAGGEYIVWLNAGDSFADADALTRLAHAAEREPNADVLYGQTLLVDSHRRVIGPRHLTAPATLCAASFKRGMVVCHQAFVARRDIMPQYDMNYRYSADYDWCIKILKQSRANAYCGDAPLIHFLSDEGTTVSHRRASLVERYRIMCRHYGALAATLHHLSFIPRYLRRKLKGR